MTEAFAWLATAIAIGASIGAAGAGALADHAGPGAAFALARRRGRRSRCSPRCSAPPRCPDGSPAVAVAAA